MDKQEWLLKRNCSLTPHQLGIAYGVLCLLSFSVAAGFLLLGAWQVFFFAGLEMAAVALAFLIYARHAIDHEHIALDDDCLSIERIEAGRMQRLRLDRRGIRIAVPNRPADLILLEAGALQIEVGRFVTPARRQQVALELRRCVPVVQARMPERMPIAQSG
jgi:uncharacterized membrane protein